MNIFNRCLSPLTALLLALFILGCTTTTETSQTEKKHQDSTENPTASPVNNASAATPTPVDTPTKKVAQIPPDKPNVAPDKDKIKKEIKPAKSTENKFQLLESSIHKILPGHPSGDIQYEYTISGVWNDAKPPQSFFWRGQGGWHTCRVVPYPGRGKSQPHMEGNLSLDEIKHGDKITLLPQPGGRYATPSFVKEEQRNTLFYQKTDGTWQQQKISTFTFTKQTAMP